jgi:hypothetical protein
MERQRERENSYRPLSSPLYSPLFNLNRTFFLWTMNKENNYPITIWISSGTDAGPWRVTLVCWPGLETPQNTIAFNIILIPVSDFVCEKEGKVRWAWTKTSVERQVKEIHVDNWIKATSFRLALNFCFFFFLVLAYKQWRPETKSSRWTQYSH